MGTTRSRILSLLQAGPKTVIELAATLQTTPNAIRAHLLILQRDGLVHMTGLSQGKRRPRQQFALSSQAERSFSRAYDPFLKKLLSVLVNRLGPQASAEIFEQAGRDMVVHLGPALQGMDSRERVNVALQVIDQLGGMVEVVQARGRTRFEGMGCPLADVVAEHPSVCRTLQAALATILATPVQSHCEHSPRPRCCFEFDSPEAGHAV